jgi:type I restriction enzyme, S subunit
MENLNSSIVGSIPIEIPRIAEQRTARARISTLRSHARSTTKTLQHAIELLSERRTALITAAVTGQIDVRDQAHISSETAIQT